MYIFQTYKHVACFVAQLSFFFLIWLLETCLRFIFTCTIIQSWASWLERSWVVHSVARLWAQLRLLVLHSRCLCGTPEGKQCYELQISSLDDWVSCDVLVKLQSLRARWQQDPYHLSETKTLLQNPNHIQALPLTCHLALNLCMMMFTTWHDCIKCVKDRKSENTHTV